MIYAISMSEDQLGIAVNALRAGDKRRARRLLGQIVHEDPENVAAWWYLGAVLDDPDQRIRCLRRVLALRPDHQEAAQLLRKLERRSVTVTPPLGTVRPVLDTVPDSAEDPRTAGESERQGSQQASDVTVAVVAVGIALVAIVLTIVLVVTGQAQGVLGIRSPDLDPTLPPLTFSVPACTRGDDLNPQIVFINNAPVSVIVSQGTAGEETPLIELDPGEQVPVNAQAGVPVRYAAETSDGGYSPGGAIIEVPEHNICRVPIQ